MESASHKWVLNVMTVPNPTQYTRLAKSIVKTNKSDFVQNVDLHTISYMFCYFLLFCFVAGMDKGTLANLFEAYGTVVECRILPGAIKTPNDVAKYSKHVFKTYNKIQNTNDSPNTYTNSRKYTNVPDM